MSYGRMLQKGAIVTGGGSGIGREICRLFAREGAKVAVMDIDKHGAEGTLSLIQEEKESKHHCVISGDVSSVDDIKRTLAVSHESFGQKPNVLVNNAAVVRGGLIDTIPDEQLDEVLNTNLRAVSLMAKYFIASVKDSDEPLRGTIVNISSMAGKMGLGTQADYAAAKAGVIGLTKSIALEYRWHKVRCNALLPGFTDTPMIEEAIDLLVKKLVRNVVPMKRTARPDEIAKACLFLSSEESSYVHGTCLEVAGGM